MDSTDRRRLYGPATPTITSLRPTDHGVELHFVAPGEEPSELTFRIYRDGQPVAEDLAGTTSSWVDLGVSPEAVGHRYEIEARYRRSDNTSHRSRPEVYLGDRGAPTQRLPLDFMAERTGRYALTLLYRNPTGPIHTGITAGVKRVELVDAQSGRIEASEYFVFPHVSTEARSSVLHVSLRAGHRYVVRVGEDAHTVNMSAFRHFDRYGGAGGREGARNDVEVRGLELLALSEP